MFSPLKGYLHRLSNRQVTEEFRALEGPSDTAPGSPGRRESGDILLKNFDVAGTGNEPTDGVHQRCLAGPVGSDQTDDLSSSDGEAHVEEHLLCPVADADTLGEECGFDLRRQRRSLQCRSTWKRRLRRGFDTLGSVPGDTFEDGVAGAVEDLYETAREVQQEHEQTDRSREELCQLGVVR